jgi:hypothetical protein
MTYQAVNQALGRRERKVLGHLESLNKIEASTQIEWLREIDCLEFHLLDEQALPVDIAPIDAGCSRGLRSSTITRAERMALSSTLSKNKSLYIISLQSTAGHHAAYMRTVNTNNDI